MAPLPTNDTLGLALSATAETFGPTPFRIEQVGGPKRGLELIGRCLPFRGYQLPVRQRGPITFPLGGSVGVAQPLGAELGSSSINGRWRQSYLNRDGTANKLGPDAGAISSIRDLVAYVEKLVIEGQHVRVTWDTWARRGLLREFVPTWDRTDICQWSMTIDWIAVDDQLPKPTKTVFDPSVSVGVLDAIFGDLDDVLSLAQGLFEPAYKVLSEAADIKDKMIRGLDRASRLIITPLELTRDMLRMTSGFITSIRKAEQTLIGLCRTAAAEVAAAALAFTTVFDGWGIPNSTGTGIPAANTPAAQAAPGTPANPYEKPTKTPPGATTPLRISPLQFNMPTLAGFATPNLHLPDDGPYAAEEVPPQDEDPIAAEVVPVDDAGITDPSGTPGAPGNGHSGAVTISEPQTQNAGDINPGGGLGSQVAQEALRRRLLGLTGRLGLEAADLLQRLKERAIDNLGLVGIWIANAGDDLRDVAVEFYGGYQGWQTIAVYNGLDNSRLVGGQVVLVPQLSGAKVTL